jgi:hypothetical protein
MLLRLRDRRVTRAAVTVAAILGLVLPVGAIRAQNNPDETAIRQISSFVTRSTTIALYFCTDISTEAAHAAS